MAVTIENDKLEASRKRRFAQALAFLRKEIWLRIPSEFVGRRIPKKERERILGYGKGGV